MIFCRLELIRSETAVGQAQIINIFFGGTEQLDLANGFLDVERCDSTLTLTFHQNNLNWVDSLEGKK